MVALHKGWKALSNNSKGLNRGTSTEAIFQLLIERKLNALIEELKLNDQTVQSNSPTNQQYVDVTDLSSNSNTAPQNQSILSTCEPMDWEYINWV